MTTTNHSPGTEPRLLAGTDDGPPCPLMEIPQAWCAHCRAEQTKRRQRIRRSRPRGTEVAHRFYARHPGTCSRCGGPYAADDYIGVTLSETYVCEECA